MTKSPHDQEAASSTAVAAGGGSTTAEARLQRLLSSNRAIVSELSLPAVLRRIVEAARDVAQARYCALGVIGVDGLLEQFVHVGMPAETVSAIGELPKGRGLLGALTADPEPIRLARISDDDRSSGFPPGHPPMDSFLGVPIRSRSEVYGNLYLTGRIDGDFTAEDEELVLALAATAGVAIENARLYEESRSRQSWLRASAEVSGLLLSPDGTNDPLQLIVDSVLTLADADVVSLVVPVGTDLLEVAVAAGIGHQQLRGLQYGTKDTLVAMALETGRGVRLGALDEEAGFTVHLSQVVDLGAVLAVPLSGKAGPQGAIVAGRRAGRANFTTADLDMAESFASHAAIATELVRARTRQQRLAVLEDRDRIARDLHDHVIQRLFAAGLSVQSLAAVFTDEQLSGRLERIVADIDDTIRQVRTTIFELRSAERGEVGLRAAVIAVARQATPSLGFEPAVWFTGPTDTLVDGAVVGDVEAVVREGLTNTAKHAGATQVTVQLVASARSLTVEVHDNGTGLGSSKRRSGLENLRRRAEDLHGTCTVTCEPDRGTRLLWQIPITS
jgi:signal transduction histidine kinase